MLNRFTQFATARFCLALLAVGFAATATASPLYFSGTNTTWDNSTTHDWSTVSGGPYTSLWSGGSDAHFEGTAGNVSVSGSIASVNSLNFDVSGYTLSSGSTNLTGSGGTINVVSAGNATINSIITGSVGMTKSGAGLLTLGGSNSYTGITLVSNGTLSLAGIGAISASTFDTSSTGSLSFGALTSASFGGLQGSGNLALSNTAAAAVALTVGGNNTSTTFSGGLSGSGSLTKLGAGMLTLSGSNTYTGATTLTAGTLQVGNGGSGATIGSTSSVLDNGSLVFNHSDNITFSPAISGNGSLTKLGAGMLMLSGSNTFSGTLTVDGGTLNIPSGSHASFEYIGYSGSGSFTHSGGTNNVANVIYLGYNSGSNGSYNLSGSGVLNAPIEYIGYGSITGSLTTGAFTQSGGTNNVTLDLYVGHNAGNGYYNLSGSGVLNAPIEFIGYSTAGSVNVSYFTQSGGNNSASNDLYLGMPNTLGSYDLSGFSLWAAFELVSYTGTGYFTQSGGTNTAPSFSVGNSGVYNLIGSGVLNATTEGIGGAGFTQTGGTNMASNFSSSIYNLSGSGMLNASTETIVGSFTQSGGTNTASNFNGGPYNLSGSGVLNASTETIGGSFTQSGGTNTASTLNLGNSSVYNLNGGTNTASKLNFGNSSVYNLNGGLLLVGSGGITRGSGAVLNFGSGTLGASAPFSSLVNMNLTAARVDTTGGNIGLAGNLSGYGWLEKVGSGTLTLSGSSAYGGPTIVARGVLAAGAANALSPNSVHFITGGTLDCSAFPQTVNSLTIDAGSVLNLSVGNVLTSLGAANFNGTLKISNLGGIVSGGTTELMSYISYSGSFSSTTLLPAGDGLVYSPGALDIVSMVPGVPTWQAATWLGDWNVAGNWSGGVVPNSAGAHAVFNNTSGSAEQASTNAPITLGRLDLTGSNSVTIAGIQGVGLTMQTTGGSVAQINVSGGANNLLSLPLTFASNGALTVASGSTLEVGYPATVSTGSLSVTTSGTVEFDAGVNVLSGGTLQQFGAIAGLQPLVKNGAGLLILSGSNSYSGGTIVAAGTLKVLSSSALPDGSNLTVGNSVAFAPMIPSTTEISPVPEPGTLSLLVAGAALLAIYRKRRYRSSRDRTGLGCRFFR